MDHYHDSMEMIYALMFPNDVNYVIGKSEPGKDWYFLHVPHATENAIAAATVNAQPRPARGRGGAGFAGRGPATLPGGGPGLAGGPATQPGGRFGRGRAGGFAAGGPATQPADGIALAPTTQGAGARAGGRGLGRGGPGAAGPGAAAGGGGGGGTRPSPWNISFEMPAAPKGVATLRIGIATNNTGMIAVNVNGQEAGRLTQLPTESSIGRNANRGIWFEREVPFDASMLKAGENKITLIVNNGGVIYDYLRLELDESAAPTN
jgi:hypothetical protein